MQIGSTPSLGTAAALDVGTSANQVVQLNGSAQLPAVSGALLTNLPSGSGSGVGYVAGRFYAPSVIDGSETAKLANTLYLMAFEIERTTVFTKIGIHVFTASAGNARLGIYNGTAGIPSTLVLDCGTVSTGTTGDKEITISQSLSPGVYFLVVVFDATPTTYSMAAGDLRPFWARVYGAATSGGVPAISATVAFTYGALPSPYNLGALTYDTSNASPSIWLRP